MYVPVTELAFTLLRDEMPQSNTWNQLGMVLKPDVNDGSTAQTVIEKALASNIGAAPFVALDLQAIDAIIVGRAKGDEMSVQNLRDTIMGLDVNPRIECQYFSRWRGKLAAHFLHITTAHRIEPNSEQSATFDSFSMGLMEAMQIDATKTPPWLTLRKMLGNLSSMQHLTDTISLENIPFKLFQISDTSP